MIDHIGEMEFYDMHPEYHPLNPPPCYMYIYSAFIELYNGSKDKITYQDIDCYSRIKSVNFSQYEIQLIFRMSAWADQTIEELRSKE